MTDREKVDIAVRFIRKIERMDIPLSTVEDIIDVDTTVVSEDGDAFATADVRGADASVLTMDGIERLRDEAWHVLADMEEL